MHIYVCTHCFNYASQQEREIRRSNEEGEETGQSPGCGQ